MRRDARIIGSVALVGYIASIFLANYFIQHVGTQHFPGGPHVITVWPKPFLEAPSGVLWIGAALLLRDVCQFTLGKWWTLAAIVVGAALSWFVAPAFAVASGVAFGLSELADFFVYTPLAERRIVWAVVASNVVGAVIDSVIFLWIAFASLDFIEGQIVGKLLITLAVLPILVPMRRRLRAVSRDLAV